MRRISGLVASVLVWWVSTVAAQWEVIDPSNLIQNTLQALSAAEDAAHTAGILADMGRQVARLGSFVLESGFTSEVEHLMAIASDLDDLSEDVDRLADRWASMFGASDVPLTSEAYTRRRIEIEGYKMRAIETATRTQTLIRDTWRIASRLLGMFDALRGLIGGTQTTQMTAQILHETNHMLAKGQVMQAAMDRVKAIDMADQRAREEAWRAINRRMMEDHPR